MLKNPRRARRILVGLILTLAWGESATFAQRLGADQMNLRRYGLSRSGVGWGDWPQKGGTSLRNNVPVTDRLPAQWDFRNLTNVKWTAGLGSQSYSPPVIANGRIFIGTNNRHKYGVRNADQDGGCLLCLDEATGRFLWRHLNQKLPTGRVHDWPEQGVVSIPAVCRNRLWYVSNRGEVVCLDTEGFTDDENDGPWKDEARVAGDEADVIWKFDLMKQLGVRPHNLSTCSVTYSDRAVFVVTGNGVGASHDKLQAKAPDFVALDRKTGEVLWTDRSAGDFTLHGSWSSPTYAVLGGRPQVIFPGGDGWVYSFDPYGDGNGKSRLLWKFDCNPKESLFVMGGAKERCEFVTPAVVYDEKLYVAVGADVEHGSGPGRIWCIDPTRGVGGVDVSPTLAVSADGKPLPRRRFQAVRPEAGEKAIPNPRSAAVWCYTGDDSNQDGKLDVDEIMHRTIACVTVKDGLLVAADISGHVHCLDVGTGTCFWQYDLMANVWAAQPLIADNKIYIADEDGEITVFEFGKTRKVVGENLVRGSVYASPVVANGVLYITDRSVLYAIAK